MHGGVSHKLRGQPQEERAILDLTGVLYRDDLKTGLPAQAHDRNGMRHASPTDSRADNGILYVTHLATIRALCE